MRARTSDGRGVHCPRCLLRGEACVCSALATVSTRTHFIILRHVIESRRSTNTGRIAALALPNSTLIDVGGGPPVPQGPLSAPRTWLLFPGFAPPPGDAPPPERLVVLDGTWKQARKLLVRVPALHRLPTLSLPAPPTPPERMRRQTVDGGMSTLEAIAFALARFEGSGAAAPLHALYAEMVQRALAIRGRRHGFSPAPPPEPAPGG
jgi:DTW domain-containing protein YfiP